MAIAAVVVGGLVIAFLAVPALGGPSLKKLVKQEVSKQLANKTGPQGAPGQSGQQGPAGPTAAGVLPDTDPVATPDSVYPASSTVIAPSSGRVLVIFSASVFLIDCSAGNPSIGAYVDGVPVPDTRRTLTDNVAADLNISGITATVSPGVHSVTIRMDCPSGTIMGTTVATNELALTGILLGG